MCTDKAGRMIKVSSPGSYIIIIVMTLSLKRHTRKVYIQIAKWPKREVLSVVVSNMKKKKKYKWFPIHFTLEHS